MRERVKRFLVEDSLRLKQTSFLILEKLEKEQNLGFQRLLLAISRQILWKDEKVGASLFRTPSRLAFALLIYEYAQYVADHSEQLYLAFHAGEVVVSISIELIQHSS